jgi:hypothetical protein
MGYRRGAWCLGSVLLLFKRYLLQRRFLLDLDKILSELRSERDRIGKAISALMESIGATSSSNGSPVRGRPREHGKGMTAAGRKRLSEAMKARWAARKSKSSSTSSATAPSRRRRRDMSEAGRKRIAEAMRKRWAEKRKAASQGGARKAQT